MTEHLCSGHEMLSLAETRNKCKIKLSLAFFSGKFGWLMFIQLSANSFIAKFCCQFQQSFFVHGTIFMVTKSLQIFSLHKDTLNECRFHFPGKGREILTFGTSVDGTKYFVTKVCPC